MVIGAQLGVVARLRQTGDQCLVGVGHQSAEQVRQDRNEPRCRGTPLASLRDVRHEPGRCCGVELWQERLPESFAQLAVVRIRLCERQVQVDRSTEKRDLRDGDMEVVAGPVGMANGCPGDDMRIDPAMRQLGCDHLQGNAVGRTRPFGQREGDVQEWPVTPQSDKARCQIIAAAPVERAPQRLGSRLIHVARQLPGILYLPVMCPHRTASHDR